MSAPDASSAPSPQPPLATPVPWWTTPLSHASQSHFVAIDGTRIHYRAWMPQDTGRPLLLFAHGYRGHARWWDWVAPFFTDRFRVVALDFSGMGDSGWRLEYDPQSFARDLLGVIAHLGGPAATVVGHSFGGNVLLRACALEPDAIAHAVIMDSWIYFGDVDRPLEKEPGPIRAPRSYPDYASARARYRLIPHQSVAETALLEHLALHSLRESAGNWQWKFDPVLPAIMAPVDARVVLPSVRMPTDIVFGENSTVISAARAREAVQLLERGRGPVMIPQAHHHLMLDQPLATISALLALLA